MNMDFHVIFARLVCLDFNSFIFIANVKKKSYALKFLFVTVSEQTDVEH